MKFKLLTLLLIFFNLIPKVYAQEKRTFTFDKNAVVYYFSSSMTTSFTKFPNHKAKIIIVNEQKNLIDFIESHKNHRNITRGKDQTLYYYIKFPRLEDENEYVKFLDEFLNKNYNEDFFDRNTVSIDFKDHKAPFSCKSLDDLNLYLAKIIVKSNDNLLNCNETYVLLKDNQNRKLKTRISYESITIKESQQKRETYKMIKSLDKFKGTYFIALTIGNHSINSKNLTDFDEETLVDINEVHSIWHLTSGYMFTNKIGGVLDLGLLYTKEESRNTDSNSNVFSINGSGNGVGVLKFGIGARYISFAKKRWSIYSDIKGGILTARAEGGTGSFTIFNGSISNTRDIKKKREKSNYLNFELGVNYRLGNLIFLTSNFQYTISNFKNDIGSVSGFGGYTINLGIGFSFK